MNWLEYTVDVAESKKYSLYLRYASRNNHSKFHIELNGQKISSEISLPKTSSSNWVTYQSTFVEEVFLSTGSNVLKLSFTKNGDHGAVIDLDYLEFSDEKNLKHRIIVSTDIGGGDPDDQQSMVHLFTYADLFDIEGLISSPPVSDGSNANHIREVIHQYAKDYSKLSKHSKEYPTPGYLMNQVKQGTRKSYSAIRSGQSTQGSRWIIKQAKKPDPAPFMDFSLGRFKRCCSNHPRRSQHRPRHPSSFHRKLEYQQRSPRKRLSCQTLSLQIVVD